VVPGIIDGQADLDLDNDPVNYEGLSLGLAFTAQNAQINGIEP